MLKQLEELHAASLVWALGRCDGNHEEALEVLQTVYLKILEGKAQFEGRSSLKTWLFGVIRRTASERRRKRWFEIFTGDRVPESGALFEPGRAGMTPEELSEESRLSGRVREVILCLSPRQREVLELVFYHDLTIEEAADVMKVSVGSARVHYDRGKKALLKEFNKKGIGL